MPDFVYGGIDGAVTTFAVVSKDFYEKFPTGERFSTSDETQSSLKDVQDYWKGWNKSVAREQRVVC